MEGLREDIIDTDYIVSRKRYRIQGASRVGARGYELGVTAVFYLVLSHGIIK
jgi:hypothetical protein